MQGVVLGNLSGLSLSLRDSPDSSKEFDGLEELTFESLRDS